MRLQLALNVADLDAAIAFYSRALGADVNEREPGYANFVVDNPALKLVLFEAPEDAERLNHVGFEVFDDAEVDAARYAPRGARRRPLGRRRAWQRLRRPGLNRW